MTAEERGMEMLHMPMKDLPPLALAFAKHLCSEVGMCIEVFLTAYTVYAQVVEGLECTDDLYRARADHETWLRQRVAEVVP
jgi:hypothetical protein